ncbi:2-C-methyl-D-erythritol 4-phosphate cytidylyltransferase [Alkalibacterium iburiense]|uniref:2-C-methyl-D-erythritol 4-phosphate cytidylyltransferase n=1 Tax=Alkalibacterium iburiense TaxID=290589 RepID=A0ABP3H2Y3_9LACT
MSENYEAVLLAAGSSKRLNGGEGQNKILKTLNNRPVFDYSLRLFLEDDHCLTIWFVVNEQEKETLIAALLTVYSTIPHKIQWVYGGEERQDSVKNALDAMENQDNRVLIHDAARPFITPDLIASLMDAVKETEAVTLAIPATDSMKMVKDTYVSASLYRPHVWHIQTPQVFSKKVIQEAMNKAVSENFYGNEEGELAERLGYKVKVVEGTRENMKITTPFDYEVAQVIAKKWFN